MASAPRIWLAALALAKVVTSIADFSVTSLNTTLWDQSTWTLTTNDFLPGHYQSRISLGNGYVGASLAAAGPFFEIDVNQTDPDGPAPTNGWPLFDARISFSTISGFYDVQPGFGGAQTNYPWLNQYGWESFIAGIPHPTAIIFEFGGHTLNSTVRNSSITNFSSSLSFKEGLASWNYTWAPYTGACFDVSFRTFFSRLKPNVVAVEAYIISRQDINGTVTDLLDGRSAARSYLAEKGLCTNGTTIWSAVHPNGLSNITGYVYSTAEFDNDVAEMSSRRAYEAVNDTTIGQTFDISLKAGQAATFHKYIGVASNDKFECADSVAQAASIQASNDGWDNLLAEHVAEWSKIMPESTVDNFTDPITGQLPDDENIKNIQIASVANTFYLLQNLQPDGSNLNDNSIAVGGLASDSYAGLIFWDADYWMSPGLNLAFPGFATQISNFRIKQHDQALANAAFNGYDNGSSLYSWTAGRYGNCTGTGPCVDYEYHLNYDIAFNLFQQYNVTNNRTWFENGPQQIIESTAMMTGQLLSFNETTGTYWIHNMTDPDEYANNVDNGAFTIGSAATLLNSFNRLLETDGIAANATWDDMAENIQFPRTMIDGTNITLEYQTMNNSVMVKQADVVLLNYPLDYKSTSYDVEEKAADLEYYSNRQSADGPAMTYSVFAINEATMGGGGCSAYTYTLNGIVTYLRAPWYQFSEQANDDYETNGGTNPAFPFLTGHGGANQVVPFGFLGLKTDQPVMYIDPSLPPQIPYVRVRTFYFAGAGFNVSINQTHTNITRISTADVDTIIDKYANTSMPFMQGYPSDLRPDVAYNISINQTIVLSNRVYNVSDVHENNMLQCVPVTSTDSYEPGQFPQAAIDGVAATRWQSTTNDTSTLLVNTSTIAYRPVDHIYIDWGSRPARTITVIISNSTSSNSSATSVNPGTSRFTIDVEVSNPYNETAAALAIVQPYVGNSTYHDFSTYSASIWSGDYVLLEVSGCWVADGAGATVGEFEVG